MVNTFKHNKIESFSMNVKIIKIHVVMKQKEKLIYNFNFIFCKSKGI